MWMPPSSWRTIWALTEVPTLLINGFETQANAPYEVLKKIVEYQAKADGVALQ